MASQLTNRPALLPTSIYVAVAVCCWLIPSQLTGDDGTAIINTYPTGAFALASAALVGVELTMPVRGPFAIAVAATWALAALSTATVFGQSWLASWVTWPTLEFTQAVLLGAAASALCALAWQVARQLRRDKHPIARGCVALGLVLLAVCSGTVALRIWGALRRPVGLEQMAGMSADLTVSLWIASAVMFCGTVIHVLLPRRAQLDAA